MKNIDYRNLTTKDCKRIQEIDASHYIKNAWREVNGVRKLVEIDYHDPSWPAGYQEHYDCLKSTIEKDGLAIGAFDNDTDRMVGFITVDREPLGEKYRYILLDQLYISKEYRGNGIGRRLFHMAADIVKGWDAEKIYIAAGSAEDTIAFYFAMGCREAQEIIPEIYESDPRDYQMEFNLS